MENAQHNKETAATITHSDIIFGTSSDDIIEDLHHGNLVDTNNQFIHAEFDDKDQIVNAQDQQEIVNPSKDDTENDMINTEVNNPASTGQNEAPTDLDTDIAESDTEMEPPLKKPGSDEIRTQKNLPKM